MQERIINVTLGDWSEDGHEKKEVFTIKLKGENLSNDNLTKTFNENLAKTGVNPFDFCSNYQSNTMSENEWEKIKHNGFSPDPQLEILPLHYNVENHLYSYPLIELLMWYTTHNTNTTWENVQYDELFSGYNPIIKFKTRFLPGYGLFT